MDDRQAAIRQIKHLPTELPAILGYGDWQESYLIAACV